MPTVVWHGSGTGWYTITLNVNDPNNTTHSFTAGGAAAVATLGYNVTGTKAGMIVVLPITGGTGSTFDVYTYNKVGVPSDDYEFQFHVIAN